MSKWVNRSTYAGSRNGTTSHTVTFTAASAGNLLVCFCAGAVTFTTPSGWTRRDSSVGGSGLYCFTKTATAGESSFTTTHNGSNYPIGAIVYEFYAGSAFHTSNAGTTGSGTASPQLSGMTQVVTCFAALSQTDGDAGGSPSATWSVGTEDLDTNVDISGTDGYLLSVTYEDDVATTTWTSTPTLTSAGNSERVSAAFTVVVAGGSTAEGISTTTGIAAATPTGTTAAVAVGDSVTFGSAVGPSAALSHAWSGSDPTNTVGDVNDYELGTSFSADEIVRIFGARVWSAGVGNSTPRSVTLWASGGSSLANVSIPSQLSPGWNEFLFSTPYEIAAATTYVISYSSMPSGSDGDYGFVSSGLDPDVSDGTVTLIQGGFADAVQIYPNNYNNTFYGVEPLYAVGPEPDPVVSGTASGASSTIGVAVVSPLPEAVGVSTTVGTASGTVESSHLNAWGGADPTTSGEASDYELGVEISLFDDLTIYGLRIWNPGLCTAATRTATLWTLAGAVIDTITLPNLMTAGWSDHYFDDPILAETPYGAVISYTVDSDGVNDDYGAVLNVFTGTTTVDTTYVRFENGFFSNTKGAFPTNNTDHYYGLDLIFTPPIVGVTGTAAGTSSTGGTAAGQVNSAPTASGTSSATGVVEVENPIVTENALPGESDSGQYFVSGAGDTDNLGFARQESVNVGETIEFSVHGDSEVITIYRIGHYGGDGWREVDEIANTPTSQPEATTISNSNGAVTCSAWSVTAEWEVPFSACSGMYVAVVRNAALNDASWIPFVVREDDRAADIVICLSTSTWGAAYNYYGGTAAPLNGKSLYGQGGGADVFTIGLRGHAMSLDRPVVSRAAIVNHWDNLESALIDWVEESGYRVKYIASTDLARGLDGWGTSQIYISAGHDEYWSQEMRDNIQTFRDAGGHVLFMTGNEIFWRVRWADDYRTMWCYKDTMPFSGHTPGDPLDPVSWTGTWKDTRWPDRKPENLITGTDFRMNGINDLTATVESDNYATLPCWRNTTMATGTDLVVNEVIGFEADTMLVPGVYESIVLASTLINIDGAYANDDGQEYTGNGDLDWGIVMHRNDPDSGIVVGFGTCQWMWALSDFHRRGNDVKSTVAQQFTANLLADLGALPQTLNGSLTVPTPVALSEYGFFGGAIEPLPAQATTQIPDPSVLGAQPNVAVVAKSAAVRTVAVSAGVGVSIAAPSAQAFRVIFSVVTGEGLFVPPETVVGVGEAHAPESLLIGRGVTIKPGTHYATASVAIPAAPRRSDGRFTAHGRDGFKPRMTPAERRDAFDLARRLRNVE